MIHPLPARNVPRYPRIPGFEPVDAVEVVDYRPVFDRGPLVIGGYQLGQRLGTGTLGPCHEAWHLRRRAPAVVKLLTIDEGVHDRLVVERALLHSLESLATLYHPRIVRLRDAGPTADGIFIAVEPARGRTLDAVLAAGWRPSDAEAITLVSDLASTLSSAHDAGLVHGNLHGGNVVLDEEHRPRLTDFGLLRTARHRAVVDEDGQRLAHRICRAPERDHGAPESVASDTYALGVLLYRLLVDEVSFDEMAVRTWNTRSRSAGWTPLIELRPDLPAALCAWVTQATDPDPSRRPGLALGLPPPLTPLRHSGSTGPVPAAAVPFRWSPRRAAVLGFTVLVVAGTVGVASHVFDGPRVGPGVPTSAPPSESFEHAAGAPFDTGRPLRRADTPDGRENQRPSLRLDR